MLLPARKRGGEEFNFPLSLFPPLLPTLLAVCVHYYRHEGSASGVRINKKKKLDNPILYIKYWLQREFLRTANTRTVIIAV